MSVPRTNFKKKLVRGKTGWNRGGKPRPGILTIIVNRLGRGFFLVFRFANPRDANAGHPNVIIKKILNPKQISNYKFQFSKLFCLGFDLLILGICLVFSAYNLVFNL